MRLAVKKWVLKIQLNGEWEQCRFTTRKEALAALTALATDYNVNLQRAVLLPAKPKAALTLTLLTEPANLGYIN
jgi:hypothetical protein